MYMKYFKIVVFLTINVVYIFIADLFAQQSFLFQVYPYDIPFYKENKILALWNPKGHPEIHKPGLKIFFFGKAGNCIRDVLNGPVITMKPTAEIARLVGLAKDEKGKIFQPLEDHDLCFNSDQSTNKGSFVYVTENPTDGGIGIFTASGIDEEGKPYSFQSRDEIGVGAGINKFEKSTAVTWKLEKEKIFPYKNKRSLKILITSSVVSLPFEVTDRKLPVQVRQQVEIGFANRDCLKQKQVEKIMCINKYVFDILVKRWGGKPLDEERGCLIFIDKAQGGLPHTACYSKPAGTRILEKNSRLSMAISCGEGVQKDVFKDKEFCYIIRWEDFLNSLRAIASIKLNKPIEQITDAELKSLFSESYANPEAWYIRVISFQQELHDPYKDRNIYISGNIKKIILIQE